MLVERLIWSHKISDYDGVAGAISRVSPAVDNDQLIIGDILNSKETHNGVNVIAIDRRTEHFCGLLRLRLTQPRSSLDLQLSSTA